MDGECQSPVFGEAIQKAMAQRGCELTLEESQRLARTLLGLISEGVIVAGSSVKPYLEIPGDLGPPQETGDSG